MFKSQHMSKCDTLNHEMFPPYDLPRLYHASGHLGATVP